MKIFDVFKSENILAETDAKRVITTTIQNQNSEVYDALIERKGLDQVKDNERENRQVLLNRATTHKKVLKSAQIEAAIAKLRQIKDKTLPEGQEYIKEITNEVNEGLREKNEKEASLSKFREDNKISHAASYSDNPNKDIAMLILAMLGEGIFNSVFLAKASDFGLVGGFFTAFVISFFNLVLAGCFVFAFRYIRHVDTKKSLFGCLGATVSLILVVGGAFLVGHYRAALDEDIESARYIAVNNWLSETFNIQTFESWLLTAVTLAIFTFFVYKLARKEELYPEYGKIHRETVAARRKYTSIKSKAIKRVNQIKQGLNQQFDSAHEELNILSKTLEEDFEALELLQQDYKSYLDSQISEFETFCEECRQRFSHECTQILDKKADLSKQKPVLEFQALNGLISSEETVLFSEKRKAVNEFQIKELEELRTEYQKAVNNLSMNKEVA